MVALAFACFDCTLRECVYIMIVLVMVHTKEVSIMRKFINDCKRYSSVDEIERYVSLQSSDFSETGLLHDWVGQVLSEGDMIEIIEHEYLSKGYYIVGDWQYTLETRFGCLGYENPFGEFVPLFNEMKTVAGPYEPNYGNPDLPTGYCPCVVKIND